MAFITANRIRLVCFDLGGVIIRLCSTWQESCARAGVAACDRALWERTRGARRELTVRYQAGRIDGRQFAHELCALLDDLYSPREILAVHSAWLRDEYPGVGDVVERLHRAGIETAALSNTNHEHWVRMGEFPTVMRLRHRLASYQLGLHKPDPAIYRALERQLGFPGGEILFFDDLAENIEAARSLGWHGQRIDPTTDTARQILDTLRAQRVLD